MMTMMGATIEMRTMADDKWMQKAAGPISKGGLHRSLGIPQGQKIPAARIAEAKRSKNPRIRQQATLAQSFAKARG